MGTSPAVDDSRSLADTFRQLSDDVRNLEIDNADQLSDQQKRDLENSSKALENAFRVLLGEDIRATLNSLQDDLEKLRKATADAQSAISQLQKIDKVFTIAVAAGDVAMGIAAKDPGQIKDGLTALTGALRSSTASAGASDSLTNTDALL